MKKRTAGGEGVASATFDVALTHAWDFDAYIVQYTGAVRLNKAHVAAQPMEMVVELFDFDCPGHGPVTEHADWAIGALERLPEGFQGCLTAGGFRAWTLRAEPFVIDTPERWEEWRAYHAGRAQALGTVIGAEPDPATDDPGRLFRLPNVVREDGKPCYPDIVGELGVSTLAPVPVALRPASATSEGSARDSILGECFAALGWIRQDDGSKLTVRCPWAHEHSKGGDDLAYIYAEGESGKFGCGHSHCVGRYTHEALAALAHMPGVREILARNLIEPDDGPSSSGEEPLLNDEPGDEVAQPVKEKSAFPLMTSEEMLAGDEPIPWVIDGLVSVGEPTLIVGGAGSGKTSAMVSLALSVASGRQVWEKFTTRRPGPVVHIDYEQGKTLRRTYLAFAKGMGLDAAAMVRDGKLKIATLPREQLLDANVTDAHLSAVGKDILGLCRGASVCVINSLTAGTNKVNENDAKIAAVFNLLSRITERTGCAFIVLHHSGRGERKGARGSSAIDGAVQTIFEIAHKKGQAFTTWEHTKDRPAGGIIDKFQLDWKNNEGAQTLRAETIQPPAPPAPGAERVEDRIQNAILFVMEHKGLSGKSRILECVRGKKAIKEGVLSDLIVKGMIEHVGSRYILGAGVVAPKTQPEGVRDEDDEYTPAPTGNRPNTGREPRRFGSRGEDE